MTIGWSPGGLERPHNCFCKKSSTACKSIYMPFVSRLMSF